MFKRHADGFQLKVGEMELRKRQIRLEEEGAEIRKLELRAILLGQAGKRFRPTVKNYSQRQVFLLTGTNARP